MNYFLDSGSVDDTRKTLAIFPELAGQTTNPSLVAKGLQLDSKISEKELWNKYKELCLELRELMPTGAISAEVYADENSTSEELYQKGKEIAEWFPEIYVKLPITKAGLETATKLVLEGVNVNMTLCFTQEQAAAVHVATMGAKKGQVFVSPFIGRLDDRGENGIDLISNISKMYKQAGSHVLVLAASIRSLEHVRMCEQEGSDLITMPVKVFEEMVSGEATLAASDIKEEVFTIIPYQELDLTSPFDSFNISHELTTTGLAKFASDWKNLLN